VQNKKIYVQLRYCIKTIAVGDSSGSDDDGSIKHHRGREIKRMEISELKEALAQLKLSTKVCYLHMLRSMYS
jgi:hypothetical protein